MVHSVSRLAFRLFVAAIFLLGPAFLAPADAQDRRQNAPGEFDFYVLSLSWSPSFCEAAAERGNTGRSQQAQCGRNTSAAFPNIASVPRRGWSAT
jgi:ribonuclease T2